MSWKQPSLSLPPTLCPPSLAGIIPPRPKKLTRPIFSVSGISVQGLARLCYAPFFNYVQPPLASNYFHKVPVPSEPPSRTRLSTPTFPPPPPPHPPLPVRFVLSIHPTVSTVFREENFNWNLDSISLSPPVSLRFHRCFALPFTLRDASFPLAWLEQPVPRATPATSNKTDNPIVVVFSTAW